MIKDSGGKFDDYSISSKIGEVLLHRGYKLTEKNFFSLVSYYQFNKQEILQKAKDKYCIKNWLLSIILKKKEKLKEKLEKDTKIYLKKKKLNLKNIKERNISNGHSIKNYYRTKQKRICEKST